MKKEYTSILEWGVNLNLKFWRETNISKQTQPTSNPNKKEKQL